MSKATTDRAVSRAYRELGAYDRAQFAELLHAVRTRSTVRVCPVVVAALRNVARFACCTVRPLADWPGAGGTMYPVIDSLAQHLLARHRVARFLASVWYGDATPAADARRHWFIAHAGGTRFRELDLPLAMTRKMEAIFLTSPDHLSVDAAMRRAELLSLGAADDVVAAVLATRLASDLANGRFWRTVMEFFVRAGDRLKPGDVGPIVDFIQSVRHARVPMFTPEGLRFAEPPEPGFSIKGRSLASVQRLVEDWHRRLRRAPAGPLCWERSRFRPMTFAEPQLDPDRPPVRWDLVELTNSAELRIEGQSLGHCVASYAYYCLWGQSRIWSLRRTGPSSVTRPVATIEVDPRTRSIVQARGLRNATVPRRASQLIAAWARRENLAIWL